MAAGFARGSVMLRFMFLFPGLLVLMFALEITASVQRALINPFTSAVARVAVFLAGLFDADVIAHERVIQSVSNGFAVEIAPGCNGVEAVIILAAAILAFPASGREKLVGLGLGMIAIQALNMVRIISLFYLGQWQPTWFEWAHLYVWQALIILDALVVWLIWLRWLSRRSGRGARMAGPASRQQEISI